MTLPMPILDGHCCEINVIITTWHETNQLDSKDQRIVPWEASLVIKFRNCLQYVSVLTVPSPFY